MRAARRASWLAAIGVLGSVLGSGGRARAFEKQWHVGLDAGYALAGFPTRVGNGFDAGLHATYGISDAFNLRAHSDVAAFSIPDVARTAVLWNAALGAEYVFDVLRWVPYLGATVGPNTMFVLGEGAFVHLGIEVPVGVGYQLTRNWTIGVEARYRLLLLGASDLSPMHNFVALGRAEFSWGG